MLCRWKMHRIWGHERPTPLESLSLVSGQASNVPLGYTDQCYRERHLAGPTGCRESWHPRFPYQRQYQPTPIGSNPSRGHRPASSWSLQSRSLVETWSPQRPRRNQHKVGLCNLFSRNLAGLSGAGISQPW